MPNYGPASPSAPSNYYAAVTPDNATNFPEGRCRSLFIGGAGTVVAVRDDGTAITFAGVAAGSTLAIGCIRVNSTGTTATSIVALY